MKRDHVTNLRAYTARRLRALDEPVEIDWHGREPVAVLVPWAIFLAWRQQLARVEALDAAGGDP